MRSLSPIEGIQRHLEAIYCLELPQRAIDFLIGDLEFETLVRKGRVPAALADTHEQLLVSPEQGGFSVALYLSDEVREELCTAPSLQSHCHATEGVSHFLMLLWAARQERPVRLLDLELQAEVDKKNDEIADAQGRRDALAEALQEERAQHSRGGVLLRRRLKSEFLGRSGGE